jgi:hypothetical protein
VPLAPCWRNRTATAPVSDSFIGELLDIKYCLIGLSGSC